MFRLCLAALLAWGGFFAPAAQAASPFPAGKWLTDDRSAVIAIAPCGADICGRITGVTLDHPTDPPPRDWRGQLLCGEQIISAHPAADGAAKWYGVITDTRNGDRWKIRMTVNNGVLHLHGYLFMPLFGQTQDWQPYSGQIGPNCMLPF